MPTMSGADAEGGKEGQIHEMESHTGKERHKNQSVEQLHIAVIAESLYDEFHGIYPFEPVGE